MTEQATDRLRQAIIYRVIAHRDQSSLNIIRLVSGLWSLSCRTIKNTFPNHHWFSGLPFMINSTTVAGAVPGSHRLPNSPLPIAETRHLTCTI